MYAQLDTAGGQRMQEAHDMLVRLSGANSSADTLRQMNVQVRRFIELCLHTVHHMSCTLGTAEVQSVLKDTDRQLLRSWYGHALAYWKWCIERVPTWHMDEDSVQQQLKALMQDEPVASLAVSSTLLQRVHALLTQADSAKQPLSVSELIRLATESFVITRITYVAQHHAPDTPSSLRYSPELLQARQAAHCLWDWCVAQAMTAADCDPASTLVSLQQTGVLVRQ